MQQKNNGFTLIEILIALFIFTIVAAIIASVLHSLLKTRSSVKQFNTQLAALQIAEITIATDLNQVVLRPIFLPVAEGGEPLIGLKGSEHQIQFVRGGYVNPLAGEVRSTLLAVGYYQRGNALIRQIASDPLAGNKQQGSAELLTAINALNFTYYDQQLRPFTTWPVTDKQFNVLPRAIRVTLVLPTAGELTQYYKIAEVTHAPAA